MKPWAPSYSALFREQMKAVGYRHQHRLRHLSVGIVGVGGVGTVVSQLLALSGLGELVLVDPQRIETVNFNRSPAMTGDEIGIPKVSLLTSWLGRRHHLRVRPVIARMESQAASSALSGVDLICCCSNTRSSRLAAARHAIRHGLPYVSAGVSDARLARTGQVLIHRPLSQATLACEGCFDGAPPRVTGVVLPSIAAIVGAIATQAIIDAFLPGNGHARHNLCLIDVARLTIDTLVVRKRPDCTICGT